MTTGKMQAYITSPSPARCTAQSPSRPHLLYSPAFIFRPSARLTSPSAADLLWREAVLSACNRTRPVHVFHICCHPPNSPKNRRLTEDTTMFFFISHSLIDGPSPHPPTRTRTERQCNTVKQAAVLSLLVTKMNSNPSAWHHDLKTNMDNNVQTVRSMNNKLRNQQAKEKDNTFNEWLI